MLKWSHVSRLLNNILQMFSTFVGTFPNMIVLDVDNVVQKALITQPHMQSTLHVAIKAKTATISENRFFYSTGCNETSAWVCAFICGDKNLLPRDLVFNPLIEAEWRINTTVWLAITSWDNGLVPVRCRAIIWTIVNMLLFESQGTHFSKNTTMFI